MQFKPISSMGKIDLVAGMVLSVIFATAVVAVGILGLMHAPTWPKALAWLAVALLIASIAIPGYRAYHLEFQKRFRTKTPGSN